MEGLNRVTCSLVLLALFIQTTSGWIRFRTPPSRRNYLEQTSRERLQNCAGKPESECGICGEGHNELQTTTIPNSDFVSVIPINHTVTIEVAFRMNMKGAFEFRACNVDQMGVSSLDIAEVCRNSLPLLLAGQERLYVPNRGQRSAKLNLTLPVDYTCDKCVIQVKYTPPGLVNSGQQQHYFDCAPISITGTEINNTRRLGVTDPSVPGVIFPADHATTSLRTSKNTPDLRTSQTAIETNVVSPKISLQVLEPVSTEAKDKLIIQNGVMMADNSIETSQTGTGNRIITENSQGFNTGSSTGERTVVTRTVSSPEINVSTLTRTVMSPAVNPDGSSATRSGRVTILRAVNSPETETGTSTLTRSVNSSGATNGRTTITRPGSVTRTSTVTRTISSPNINIGSGTISSSNINIGSSSSAGQGRVTFIRAINSPEVRTGSSTITRTVSSPDVRTGSSTITRTVSSPDVRTGSSTITRTVSSPDVRAGSSTITRTGSSSSMIRNVNSNLDSNDLNSNILNTGNTNSNTFDTSILEQSNNQLGNNVNARFKDQVMSNELIVNISSGLQEMSGNKRYINGSNFFDIDMSNMTFDFGTGSQGDSTAFSNTEVAATDTNNNTPSLNQGQRYDATLLNETTMYAGLDTTDVNQRHRFDNSLMNETAMFGDYGTLTPHNETNTNTNTNTNTGVDNRANTDGTMSSSSVDIRQYDNFNMFSDPYNETMIDVNPNNLDTFNTNITRFDTVTNDTQTIVDTHLTNSNAGLLNTNHTVDVVNATQTIIYSGLDTAYINDNNSSTVLYNNTLVEGGFDTTFLANDSFLQQDATANDTYSQNERIGLNTNVNNEILANDTFWNTDTTINDTFTYFNEGIAKDTNTNTAVTTNDVVSNDTFAKTNQVGTSDTFRNTDVVVNDNRNTKDVLPTDTFAHSNQVNTLDALDNTNVIAKNTIYTDSVVPTDAITNNNQVNNIDRFGNTDGFDRGSINTNDVITNTFTDNNRVSSRETFGNRDVLTKNNINVNDITPVDKFANNNIGMTSDTFGNTNTVLQGHVNTNDVISTDTFATNNQFNKIDTLGNIDYTLKDTVSATHTASTDILADSSQVITNDLNINITNDNYTNNDMVSGIDTQRTDQMAIWNINRDTTSGIYANTTDTLSSWNDSLISDYSPTTTTPIESSSATVKQLIVNVPNTIIILPGQNTVQQTQSDSRTTALINESSSSNMHNTGPITDKSKYFIKSPTTSTAQVLATDTYPPTATSNIFQIPDSISTSGTITTRFQSQTPIQGIVTERFDISSPNSNFFSPDRSPTLPPRTQTDTFNSRTDITGIVTDRYPISGLPTDRFNSRIDNSRLASERFQSRTETSGIPTERFPSDPFLTNTDMPINPTERYPTNTPGIPADRYPTNTPGIPAERYPTNTPGIPAERYPTNTPGISAERYPTNTPGISAERYPTNTPGISAERYPTQTERFPTNRQGVPTERYPTQTERYPSKTPYSDIVTERYPDVPTNRYPISGNPTDTFQKQDIVSGVISDKVSSFQTKRYQSQNNVNTNTRDIISAKVDTRVITEKEFRNIPKIHIDPMPTSPPFYSSTTPVIQTTPKRFSELPSSTASIKTTWSTSRDSSTSGSNSQTTNQRVQTQTTNQRVQTQTTNQRAPKQTTNQRAPIQTTTVDPFALWDYSTTGFNPTKSNVKTTTFERSTSAKITTQPDTTFAETSTTFAPYGTTDIFYGPETTTTDVLSSSKYDPPSTTSKKPSKRHLTTVAGGRIATWDTRQPTQKQTTTFSRAASTADVSTAYIATTDYSTFGVTDNMFTTTQAAPQTTTTPPTTQRSVTVPITTTQAVTPPSTTLRPKRLQITTTQQSVTEPTTVYQTYKLPTTTEPPITPPIAVKEPVTPSSNKLQPTIQVDVVPKTLPSTKTIMHDTIKAVNVVQYLPDIDSKIDTLGGVPIISRTRDSNMIDTSNIGTDSTITTDRRGDQLVNVDTSIVDSGTSITFGRLNNQGIDASLINQGSSINFDRRLDQGMGIDASLSGTRTSTNFDRRGNLAVDTTLVDQGSSINFDRRVNQGMNTDSSLSGILPSTNFDRRGNLEVDSSINVDRSGTSFIDRGSFATFDRRGNQGMNTDTSLVGSGTSITFEGRGLPVEQGTKIDNSLSRSSSSIAYDLNNIANINPTFIDRRNTLTTDVRGNQMINVDRSLTGSDATLTTGRRDGQIVNVDTSINSNDATLTSGRRDVQMVNGDTSIAGNDAFLTTGRINGQMVNVDTSITGNDPTLTTGRMGGQIVNVDTSINSNDAILTPGRRDVQMVNVDTSIAGNDAFLTTGRINGQMVNGDTSITVNDPTLTTGRMGGQIVNVDTSLNGNDATLTTGRRDGQTSNADVSAAGSGLLGGLSVNIDNTVPGKRLSLETTVEKTNKRQDSNSFGNLNIDLTNSFNRNDVFLGGNTVFDVNGKKDIDWSKSLDTLSNGKTTDTSKSINTAFNDLYNGLIFKNPTNEQKDVSNKNLIRKTITFNRNVDRIVDLTNNNAGFKAGASNVLARDITTNGVKTDVNNIRFDVNRAGTEIKSIKKTNNTPDVMPPIFVGQTIRKQTKIASRIPEVVPAYKGFDLISKVNKDRAIDTEFDFFDPSHLPTKDTSLTNVLFDPSIVFTSGSGKFSPRRQSNLLDTNTIWKGMGFSNSATKPQISRESIKSSLNDVRVNLNVGTGLDSNSFNTVNNGNRFGIRVGRIDTSSDNNKNNNNIKINNLNEMNTREALIRSITYTANELAGIQGMGQAVTNEMRKPPGGVNKTSVGGSPFWDINRLSDGETTVKTKVTKKTSSVTKTIPQSRTRYFTGLPSTGAVTPPPIRAVPWTKSANNDETRISGISFLNTGNDLISQTWREMSSDKNRAPDIMPPIVMPPIDVKVFNFTPSISTVDRFVPGNNIETKEMNQHILKTLQSLVTTLRKDKDQSNALQRGETIKLNEPTISRNSGIGSASSATLRGNTLNMKFGISDPLYADPTQGSKIEQVDGNYKLMNLKGASDERTWNSGRNIQLNITATDLGKLNETQGNIGFKQDQSIIQLPTALQHNMYEILRGAFANQSYGNNESMLDFKQPVIAVTDNKAMLDKVVTNVFPEYTKTAETTTVPYADQPLIDVRKINVMNPLSNARDTSGKIHSSSGQVIVKATGKEMFNPFGDARIQVAVLATGQPTVNRNSMGAVKVSDHNQVLVADSNIGRSNMQRTNQASAQGSNIGNRGRFYLGGVNMPKIGSIRTLSGVRSDNARLALEKALNHNQMPLLPGFAMGRNTIREAALNENDVLNLNKGLNSKIFGISSGVVGSSRRVPLEGINMASVGGTSMPIRGNSVPVGGTSSLGRSAISGSLENSQKSSLINVDGANTATKSNSVLTLSEFNAGPNAGVAIETKAGQITADSAMMITQDDLLNTLRNKLGIQMTRHGLGNGFVNVALNTRREAIGHKQPSSALNQALTAQTVVHSERVDNPIFAGVNDLLQMTNQLPVAQGDMLASNRNLLQTTNNLSVAPGETIASSVGLLTSDRQPITTQQILANSMATKTDQSDASMCGAGRRFVCKAVGTTSETPGMVWWCFNNCKKGQCPKNKCSCACETITMAMGESKTSLLGGVLTNTASQTDSTLNTNNITKRKLLTNKVINLTLNGPDETFVPVGENSFGKKLDGLGMSSSSGNLGANNGGASMANAYGINLAGGYSAEGPVFHESNLDRPTAEINQGLNMAANVDTGRLMHLNTITPNANMNTILSTMNQNGGHIGGVSGTPLTLNNPATGSLLCKGINVFAKNEGIDQWCTNVCNRNDCPADICACV